MAKPEKKDGHKEPVKDTPGMVSIHNKGVRTFITSAGKLLPGKSLAVPVEEAEGLLAYPELLETGKVPKKDSRTIAQLKAENEKLTADLEAANALLAEKKEGNGK
jgi:hypothetical protein